MYKCLHKAKLSNKSNSVHRNDGLILNDSFITTALKCVPPGDKPTRNELNNCFKYFKNEIFNICSNNPQNLTEIITKINSLTGKKPKLFKKIISYKFTLH